MTITDSSPQTLTQIQPHWAALPSVQAFSTTRQGGVSLAPFDSLNLGAHVGDDAEHVRENRRRVKKAFNLPSEPIWLNQVHGIEVVELVQQDFVEPPTADAITTQVAGRVLAIMTADCLPLILTNQAGTEVAAIHAGWRSLAGGIIEKTIARMHSNASDLIVWAGPCIGPDSFQIGAEVQTQLGGSPANYKISIPSNSNAIAARSKLLANLYALAGERLQALGINNYSHSSACTYQDQDTYFSHRRSGGCGRMATFIWMAG